MRKILALLAYSWLSTAACAQVIGGGSPPVTSQSLDSTLGATRGGVAERGATGWTNQPPGTANLPYVSNGPGADPAYQTLTGPGIAAGTVANSNLANMAAGTVKANATGSPAAPQDATATSWFDQAYCNTVGFIITRLSGSWACARGLPIQIDWFSGVDPTGVADSTTGIQNIINALPLSGSSRMFCTGNYKISSPLTMGNGTSSAGSTTQGFILEGVGNPVTAFTLGGFTVTAGCKFTWNGGAADMLQIKGPLQGWGVKNVYFNCAGATAATRAIHVTSAQTGDNANIVVNGCSAVGIDSDTVAVFAPFTNTDSYGNSWYGTYVTVPNTANAVGIRLTGTLSSNTDYNNFYKTAIAFAGNCTGCIGLDLVANDNNFFWNFQFPGASGSNVTCVALDYTVNAVWPASDGFFGVDTGNAAAGCATPWNNLGTPASGARPNAIYALAETNGAVVPNLANLAAFTGHDIILALANGTNARLTMDNGGHFGLKGTTPTLTAGCNGAGSSVTGNSFSGYAGGQTAAATSCTLTFSPAFQSNPICVPVGSTAAITSFSVTTATLVVNFPSTAGFTFGYTCTSVN